MEEKSAFKPDWRISGWNSSGILCLVFSILFFILNRKFLYGNMLEQSLETVLAKLAVAAALLSIPILWCGSALALGIWNHDTAPPPESRQTMRSSFLSDNNDFCCVVFDKGRLFFLIESARFSSRLIRRREIKCGTNLSG